MDREMLIAGADGVLRTAQAFQQDRKGGKLGRVRRLGD